MDNYTFCTQILEEIRLKLTSPSEYNYIAISGLIRKLIFDKNRVLVLAEKHSNKKFIFYVSGALESEEYYREFPALKFFIAGILSGEVNSRGVSLDEYGKLPVLYAANRCFSIKDVVKYVANKRGGIHLDENDLDDNQKIIHAWSKEVGMNGIEIMFHQVGYIGQNILSSAIKCGFVGY